MTKSVSRSLRKSVARIIDRVTVVVVTHNRSADLRRTLERMLALPHPPAIVVVDNASTDSTASLVIRHFPQVKLVSIKQNIGAAARNIGVQLVTTPYVAFCDDDSWWHSGSLESAVVLLDIHPGVAVLCARVLIGPEEREDPTSAAMAYSPLPAGNMPGPSQLDFLACAAVVRRKAFLEAGGYEAKFFIGGEESLLTLDLVARGWSLAYVPHLIVHQYPSPRRDSEQRRKYLVRNALWLAWMRLPLPLAARQTWKTLRCAYRCRLLTAGLLSALRGLPWAIRQRNVIPTEIAYWYRKLQEISF
ncbi:glycosyltransferase family 2 protein [soil metagenome]